MNNTNIRRTLTRYGIDGFWLKIIALTFMTLDHIGEYIFADGIGFSPLRILGRIAAPLFLYGIVQSAKYTKSKTKFLVRLYVAHIVICLITLLLGRTMPTVFGSQNQFSILSTFFYVVLFIKVFETIAEAVKINAKTTIRNNIGLVILIIIIPIVLMPLPYYESVISIFLPSILTIPYSPLFVIMGVMWYFANKKKQWLILAAFSTLSFVGYLFFRTATVTIFLDYFSPIQFFMIFSLPFIALYNGKRGKPMKYFFYIYYPLHVYILIIILYILRG